MTPHLIHIGYPKSGSNFLRRWFAGHPQLAFAHGGMAGFHDVYDLVRQASAPPSAKRYRVTSAEGFATPQPGFGDALTNHDLPQPVSMADAQRAVCSTLAELFPGATILLVTRGFAAAIVSLYSQYARTAGWYDFARFCIAIEETPSLLDYCALIDVYAAAFGRENVIVFPYELLRDDAAAFTGALESRLGLDHFAPARERVNASLSPAEMYWYPRLTRAVRRLPFKRVERLYARAAFANRLRLPIRMLDRLRPGVAITTDAIPQSLIDSLRGRADCLRHDPLYAPYAGDYLIQS